MRRILSPILLSSSAATTHSSSSSAHFSTSISSHFFLFNRPKSVKHSIESELISAQRDNRLDLIPKLYSSLLDSTSDRSTNISHDKLTNLLKFISQSNRSNLLLKIFSDLSTFGYEGNAIDHHYVLLGLTKMNKPSKALKWIQAMNPTYGIMPSILEWNIVVNGYKRAKDIEGMMNVLELMKKQNVATLLPNIVTYNSIIAALLEVKDLTRLQSIRMEMEERGIVPDMITETTLMRSYLKMQEMESARNARTRLEALMSDIPAERWDVVAINALIKFKAEEAGYVEALKLVQQYRLQGSRLDQYTMSTLAIEGVKGIASGEEARDLIDELEGVVGINADRFTWSMLINAIIQKSGGDVMEALKVYQEARDRSIVPDSPMIQPLLSALLSPSPTPATFVIAKSLYEDLTASTKDYRSRPDLAIYVTLLKACADPTSPDLDFSHILLNDMKESGVALESSTIAWHITALMRAASSYGEAFKAYDTVRAMDVAALDESAYNQLLLAFTSLTFPNPSAPTSPPVLTTAPANMIHEFLTDMRRSNHPPSSITYTILLDHFAKTYTTSHTAILRIHSLIKLDINVDPDTALFNALMNAYSRVGAFAASFRVWESMRINKGIEIDRVSLFIILDTCGYECGPDGKRLGRSIWSEFTGASTKGKGKLNGMIELEKKHYDTWIECLGRWGEHDEAERVAFEDMAVTNKIVADQDTFEILLKFALRDKKATRRETPRWERLRDRMIEERKEVWEEVKGLELWSGNQVIDLQRGVLSESKEDVR